MNTTKDIFTLEMKVQIVLHIFVHLDFVLFVLFWEGRSCSANRVTQMRIVVH